MEETSEKATNEELSGKYLPLFLADEEYGLEILKIQEIIDMTPITRAPRTPDFVRGVINLRGKVIPVVDLRLKFGLESKRDTDTTCVIVVQVTSGDSVITLGVIVDEVSEMLDVTADQIDETPALGPTSTRNSSSAWARSARRWSRSSTWTRRSPKTSSPPSRTWRNASVENHLVKVEEGA